MSANDFGEWISVDDRLPEFLPPDRSVGEKDFIGFNGHGVFPTTYIQLRDDEYSPGFFKHPITHWRPLPPPPTERGG